MKSSAESRLRSWPARMAAITMALFLALFALDAFEGTEGVLHKLAHFAIHLWPTGLLVLVIALAWRRPRVGVVAFVLLAVAYAVWAWDHPQWVLVISGPLLLVAALYALAARRSAGV